jgi:tRNA U34 5-carboxymethylaminomethyl modifying enzyme MnmG/GidA
MTCPYENIQPNEQKVIITESYLGGRLGAGRTTHSKGRYPDPQGCRLGHVADDPICIKQLHTGSPHSVLGSWNQLSMEPVEEHM